MDLNLIQAPSLKGVHEKELTMSVLIDKSVTWS